MTTIVADSTAPRSDQRQLSDRLLVLLILLGSVLGILHSLWMLVAVLPAVLSTFSPLRSSPWWWMLSGGCCITVAAINWSVFEDHVFFGVYQLIAVGIAMTRDDFRQSIRVQLRWLTGTLFGVAVAWKLLSSSYLTGDLFRTVLVIDGRFDPITRLVGGASNDALVADRELLHAIARGEVTPNQELDAAAALSIVSPLLSIWTITIELIIAIAFLAPDAWRVTRLRHPALLVFCVTTYASGSSGRICRDACRGRSFASVRTVGLLAVSVCPGLGAGARRHHRLSRLARIPRLIGHVYLSGARHPDLQGCQRQDDGDSSLS